MYNELKIGFDLMTSKENNTNSNNTGTIIEEKIEVIQYTIGNDAPILDEKENPLDFIDKIQHILVMQSGQIIAKGTHLQLLKQCAEYQELTQI